LARGDLEFWSAAEKLQMTAAWDSQNGLRPKRRSCDSCYYGFSQKVRRQNNLKIFLPECSCQTVMSCRARATANQKNKDNISNGKSLRYLGVCSLQKRKYVTSNEF